MVPTECLHVRQVSRINSGLSVLLIRIWVLLRDFSVPCTSGYKIYVLRDQWEKSEMSKRDKERDESTTFLFIFENEDLNISRTVCPNYEPFSLWTSRIEIFKIRSHVDRFDEVIFIHPKLVQLYFGFLCSCTSIFFSTLGFCTSSLSILVLQVSSFL